MDEDIEFLNREKVLLDSGVITAEDIKYLNKIKILLDSGVITAEEYKKKKEKHLEWVSEKNNTKKIKVRESIGYLKSLDELKDSNVISEDEHKNKKIEYLKSISIRDINLSEKKEEAIEQLKLLKELLNLELITKEEFENKEKEYFDIELKKINSAPKSRVLYIVLSICLGVFGAHNFYAGYERKGLFQFFLCLFCIFSPFVFFPFAIFTPIIISVLFIWGIVEGLDQMELK